jgi:hypothetical protein
MSVSLRILIVVYNRHVDIILSFSMIGLHIYSYMGQHKLRKKNILVLSGIRPTSRVLQRAKAVHAYGRAVSVFVIRIINVMKLKGKGLAMKFLPRLVKIL